MCSLRCHLLLRQIKRSYKHLALFHPLPVKWCVLAIFRELPQPMHYLWSKVEGVAKHLLPVVPPLEFLYATKLRSVQLLYRQNPTLLFSSTQTVQSLSLAINYQTWPYLYNLEAIICVHKFAHTCGTTVMVLHHGTFINPRHKAWAEGYCIYYDSIYFFVRGR